MNKLIKCIAIFAGIIISLWTIGRLTNTVQFYTVPSLANYPTIKNGDHIFATNLMKPQRFDFICYYSDSTETGRNIFTHRLCGLEGDKIEIIRGDLFVNDHSVDNNLSLAHNYILTNQEEIDLVKKNETIEESFIYQVSTDSTIACVSDKTIKDNSIKAKRLILPKESKDEYVNKKYGQNWNLDNFGPVIVPKGTYFVLGDNRLNSLDSRYAGFIDKSRFISTVIGR